MSTYLNPIAYQHYRELPAGMFAESGPGRSCDPALLALNRDLLEQLGGDVDWFCSEQGLAVLSGNAVSDVHPPIAMAYGGHQFGHWVPLLGDGRAHMLGQFLSQNGERFDVQLKGSGRTPYSRGGDGRATMGSVIREYVVSEAMAALGIPTTRSIAIVSTGEQVMRERAFPGAILVRMASSHLRVGSFQYAAANLDEQGMRDLADFVIASNFPELVEKPDKYRQLLCAVAARQASLIAQWMLVGFIHGVMNTDNTSIVGETIDYGPCAFMDEFHPNKVFSSIDQHGRYAWDQQPSIGYWNLGQFAGTLLPLLHDTPDKAEAIAEESLSEFVSLFQTTFRSGLRRKLGLTGEGDEIAQFGERTLVTMADSGIDFTVFFDRLTHVATGESEDLLLTLFEDREVGVSWLAQWQGFRSQCPAAAKEIRGANPMVIARNHRIEEAILAAVDHGDFEPYRRLCRVLATPFELATADFDLQTPPQLEERVRQTFCGT